MIVVAIDGERWVGMVACRLLDESQHLAVGAVGRPERARRRPRRAPDRGGGRLVATSEARTTIELSVTTNNRPAAELYARTGFTETGRRRPLPSDPSRTEVFLSRPVRP